MQKTCTCQTAPDPKQPDSPTSSATHEITATPLVPALNSIPSVCCPGHPRTTAASPIYHHALGSALGDPAHPCFHPPDTRGRGCCTQVRCHPAPGPRVAWECSLCISWLLASTGGSWGPPGPLESHLSASCRDAILRPRIWLLRSNSTFFIHLKQIHSVASSTFAMLYSPHHLFQNTFALGYGHLSLPFPVAP